MTSFSATAAYLYGASKSVSPRMRDQTSAVGVPPSSMWTCAAASESVTAPADGIILDVLLGTHRSFSFHASGIKVRLSHL